MTAELRALFLRLRDEPRRLFFPVVLPDRNTLDAAQRKFVFVEQQGLGAGAYRPRRRVQLYAHLKEGLGAALAGYATRVPVDPFDGKALIACVWREPTNRRDPDNVISGGRKFIMDALARGRAGARGWRGAGHLHCDGRHCVAGFADIFVTDVERPGVEVTIAPVQLALPLSGAAREAVIDLRRAP